MRCCSTVAPYKVRFETNEIYHPGSSVWSTRPTSQFKTYQSTTFPLMQILKLFSSCAEEAIMVICRSAKHQYEMKR